MAYPSIADYNTGSTASNATYTTITPPATTQANDLLLLFFTKDGSAAPTGNSGGFTVLTGSADSGSASYMTIFYKQITGPQSNFTVSHASEMTSWIIVRIPGGQIPQYSTVARASSNVPNPDSLTHTLGAGKEILWIACAGWDYNRTCSAYPTTFTSDRYTVSSSATGGSGTAIASLQSTTNPQDPGTFTISSADTWCAYTLAIEYVAPVTVTLSEITGIPVPVPTNPRDSVINSNAQFTASVSWSPNDSEYTYSTIYTATLTLTPKFGYTMTGVSANFFTLSGTTSCTNSADSGVVTAVFPETDALTTPYVASTSSYTSGGVASADVTLNLPSGSGAGDLILILYVTSVAVGWTYNPPSWTLYDTRSVGTRESRLFYKLLTETETTVNFQHSSTYYHYTCYRITGAGTNFTSSVTSGSNTTTQDPVSHNSGFPTSTTTLWVLPLIIDDPTTLYFPEGYGSQVSTSYAAMCSKKTFSGTTQDPPAYTTSDAVDYAVFTMAVRAATPIISVNSYSRTKISDETGYTTCSVTFQCSSAATQWEARATIDSQTPAPGVGILVGSGSSINANTDTTFDVDYTELTSGDRVYQITVYCYVDGTWY